MKLYFIRHGQSEANIGRMQAGQADSKLTEQGREDALNARKILKNIPFDKVYSSDLSRARITQEIALSREDVIITELIREIDVGNKLEGKTYEKCEEEFGEVYVLDRAQFNFQPYGGENYQMLEKRVTEFLQNVLDDGGECVAAFSHGGFINAVLGFVLGCHVTTKQALSDNCGVSVFEYSNNTWKLVKWNMTAQ